MNRYKNHLIAATVLSVLAVIGTIMNSRQASAQGGGPKVTIESPIPLPVTGSTTVSGTVAATQSGAWNVGINGTPNVHVTNPATAPVLALNVNDPGRIPYQSNRVGFCGGAQCSATFPAVPSHQRLVVQHFSADVGWSVVPSTVIATLGFSTVGFSSVFLAPLSGTTSSFDQPVLVYFDGGQTPVATVSAVGVGTVVGGDFHLTGYLLDCSIAPCAAIAQ
jgi:hypothetical protein